MTFYQFQSLIGYFLVLSSIIFCTPRTNTSPPLPPSLSIVKPDNESKIAEMIDQLSHPYDQDPDFIIGAELGSNLQAAKQFRSRLAETLKGSDAPAYFSGDIKKAPQAGFTIVENAFLKDHNQRFERYIELNNHHCPFVENPQQFNNYDCSLMNEYVNECCTTIRLMMSYESAQSGNIFQKGINTKTAEILAPECSKLDLQTNEGIKLNFVNQPIPQHFFIKLDNTQPLPFFDTQQTKATLHAYQQLEPNQALSLWIAKLVTARSFKVYPLDGSNDVFQKDWLNKLKIKISVNIQNNRTLIGEYGPAKKIMELASIIYPFEIYKNKKPLINVEEQLKSEINDQTKIKNTPIEVVFSHPYYCFGQLKGTENQKVSSTGIIFLINQYDQPL